MDGWFEFEGHRIWYRRVGAGERMLFLHNGADSHLWDYQVKQFRKTHDVITPDLIGFGRSDKPDIPYTLDLYARFLEKCVDELRLAPVTLVGAGVGSAASLRYAYTHPENVRTLVLIGTLTSETVAAGEYAVWIPLMQLRLPRAAARFLVRRGLIPRWLPGRAMRQAFGEKVDESFAAYQNEQRRRDRRSILTELSMGEHNATYAAPDSAPPPGFPPVCSIWGAADRILPAAAGRAFCDALGPDERHVLEGAGHMTPLERPDKVNAIIESFLRRFVPAASSEPSRVEHDEGGHGS